MHDNCPGFVSDDFKKVLTSLNVPGYLTSPASFPALVVGGCFAALKAYSFNSSLKDNYEKHQQDTNGGRNKKQRFMTKVSSYLKSLTKDKISSIEAKRIAKLRGFLHREII